MPLEHLREHCPNLWRRGALACDWMELAGPEAPMLQVLLDEGALANGARFIGVDSNASVIEDCKERYRDVASSTVWLTNPLQVVLNEADPQVCSEVGVLIYDTQKGVWSSKWAELEMAVRFAQKQRKELGSFLLVVNVVGNWSQAPNAEPDYLARLTSLLGRSRPIQSDNLHRYVSRKREMLWVMVPM